MIEASPADLLISLMCALTVPLLVSHYLRGPAFPESVRFYTLLGGLLWVAYSWIAEHQIYEMLGLWRADSAIHWRLALRATAQLEMGKWPFHGAFPLSNEAYVTYLALLHYYTGATSQGATTINGWLAFMGGLTLARTFSRCFPPFKMSSTWWIAIVFFPSTIFWATTNMKEGPVIWGICQMISTLEERSGSSRASLKPTQILGTGVVGILRPHICAVWIISIAAAMLLSRRVTKVAFVLLLVISIPLAYVATRQLAQISATNPSTVIDRMEDQAKGLSDPRQGSNIEYGSGGSIFFVSGFTALFFRPFPWALGSARTAICAVETWTITLLMIWAWWRLGSGPRRVLLQMPIIRAAIIASLFFSVFFSYVPNEGLLARQRVQFVPALLALSFLPVIFQRFQLWRANILRNYQAGVLRKSSGRS